MLTFLQLSDIHFRNLGAAAREEDAFEIDGNDSEAQDYAQRELLIEDARNLAEQLGGYSAVLVAGDIANEGERRQYSQASAWLRNLCTAIGVKPWMVWTVPGNHDIEDDRIDELGRELRERLRGAGEDTLDAVLEAILVDESEGPALIRPLENYIEFAHSFDCGFDPARLHWTSDLPLSGGLGLQLRGLSSALLCAKGDRLPTLVGGRQAGDWEEGRVHLSICHHPHDWLLDGAGLDQRFGENVQVRITGHLHKRELQPTEIGVYLQAGAVSPERDVDGGYHEGYEPTYDVITVREVDGESSPGLEIAVHARCWDDEKGSWRAAGEKVWRFAAGGGTAVELDERPRGDARRPGAPLREARYRLAHLPITDKYKCLEDLGAPMAHFLDEPAFSLVAATFRWAEKNRKLDELVDLIQTRAAARE